MTDKQLVNDNEFISRLCDAIEKRIGRKFVTPRDFIYLSNELAKVGKRISDSTLKRIWGYNRDISENYRPYPYTLVSLVNLLGYQDIEDFNANYNNPDDVQSANFFEDTVKAKHIMPGSIVELSWAPERKCSLLCMEECRFKVVHSERGRLQPGDVVVFMSLTQNAPLYFNEVFRPETNEKFVYTAGQRTGVRYHIRGIVNSDEESILSS